MWITYFIDDKLGGIASLNHNLIRNNTDKQVKQRVVLIDKKESTFTRNTIQFAADEVIQFTYSDNENLYDVIRRLRESVPEETGVIVLNDCLEMQMLDHFKVQQTSYQIIHDEYNLGLALNYPHIVDVFIAHARFFYDKLVEALPDRKHEIFYRPHGVPIPAQHREAKSETDPVKLLFLGRMNRNKGIFDLPVIAQWLNEWKIPFQFTCIGNGPELPSLQKTWGEQSNVSFLSPESNEEVVAICASHDVYVLPTKFEGSPVALLETMSTGLAPVITDLPGGIREIVTEDIGFRITEGDNRAFAEKIMYLAQNPETLNACSLNARKKIIEQFDVKKTSAAYHGLFNKYQEYLHPKQLQHKKIGSRLDQPFMPSFLTSLLRKKLKK